MLQTQIRDRQEQERERNDEIKAWQDRQRRPESAKRWRRKKQQGEGQEIREGSCPRVPMPKKAEEFVREIQILTEADETGKL